MSTAAAQHKKLSKIRRRAYKALFGSEPAFVVSSADFDEDETTLFIDVCFYETSIDGGDTTCYVGITDGLSDEAPGGAPRHEMIQYFDAPDEDSAWRLYETARLPRFDKFRLVAGDTITVPAPVVESRFPVSLFLSPAVAAHREFEIVVEGDKTQLLWLVPISQAEQTFKQKNGLAALTKKMDEKKLDPVFDEETRPKSIL